jgi:hypothetical protein
MSSNSNVQRLINACLEDPLVEVHAQLHTTLASLQLIVRALTAEGASTDAAEAGELLQSFLVPALALQVDRVGELLLAREREAHT